MSWQRVVKRAEIGIDLLLHVARQEAQAFPGLDRRPRQDETVHPPVQQHGHRDRYRKIGLARPRRPQPEHEFIAAEGIEIGGLGRRTGNDGTPPGPDPRHGRGGRHVFARRSFRQADGAIDIARADVMAAFQPAIEIAQGMAGDSSGGGIARDGDAVAARRDGNAQRAFDPRQMDVMLPEQARQQPVVLEIHHQGTAVIPRAWGIARGGHGRMLGAGFQAAASAGSARWPPRLFGWALSMTTSRMRPIRWPGTSAWTACI